MSCARGDLRPGKDISEWISVKKVEDVGISKELIPDFSEINKNECTFLMKGECHFIIYDKGRTSFNQVFISEEGPYDYRFYVAKNAANFYKILYTKVQDENTELEYFANWIYKDMTIQHYRKKVVYLAYDTVEGYQSKVTVHFKTEEEKYAFLKHFREGVANDKAASVASR